MVKLLKVEAQAAGVKIMPILSDKVREQLYIYIGLSQKLGGSPLLAHSRTTPLQYNVSNSFSFERQKTHIL